MVVFGIHPVLEALEATEVDIDGIWITRGKSGKRLQEIIDRARGRGIPLHFELSTTLSRKSDSRQHQDVVAELSALKYSNLESVLEKPPSRLLILDRVEDPRNLGGVLRTAEAIGVGAVLLPRRGSCGITSTVIKTSAGAALHMKVCRVGNLVQATERLKKEGYWLVGLDLSGEESLDQVDTSLPLAIVVGGERNGLRRLVREKCDFLVRIPMVGRVSSLNLSVAAAVLLYMLAKEPMGENPTSSSTTPD
jgi:23S rRNA (guanosine2251-2'-O)-methyltransferase